MTWDYRVVLRTVGDESVYAIHEVYYDDDETITGYTENSVSPQGDTFEDLVKDLQLMIRGTEKSLVRWEDLPGSCDSTEK